MTENDNIVLKMNLMGGMLDYLHENLDEDKLFDFVIEDKNFEEFCKLFGKLIS